MPLRGIADMSGKLLLAKKQNLYTIKNPQLFVQVNISRKETFWTHLGISFLMEYGNYKFFIWFIIT